MNIRQCSYSTKPIIVISVAKEETNHVKRTYQTHVPLEITSLFYGSKSGTMKYVKIL